MKSINDEFLNVLSRYQPLIRKVGYIYFRTEADREENFQEIVFQLWKGFPKLKDKNKLTSWIYTVAINTSISKIRTDSRFVLQDHFPETTRATDPFDRIHQDEKTSLLLRAIHRLNDIDKSIILLYLDELSYEEIAGVMGMTKTNIGVRINRAKQALKQYLNELDYGR